jgi:ribosomal protein S18 acetylase RimI-like enzyme
VGRSDTDAVATPQEDVVAVTRTAIGLHGVSSLVIDDLVHDDLDKIAWSGDPRHPIMVGQVLDRVAGGEVAYLAVRAPNGWPVAKVGIDFATYPDAGVLWQFATHPGLQGQGVGSHLIAGAERRIVSRGRPLARIGVEDDNPGARRLYERLGFVVDGHDTESWERSDGDGRVTTHHAQVTRMRKDLG